MQSRDKTEYVRGHGYRWDSLLSRITNSRIPHIMPPWRLITKAQNDEKITNGGRGLNNLWSKNITNGCRTPNDLWNKRSQMDSEVCIQKCHKSRRHAKWPLAQKLSMDIQKRQERMWVAFGRSCRERLREKLFYLLSQKVLWLTDGHSIWNGLVSETTPSRDRCECVCSDPKFIKVTLDPFSSYLLWPSDPFQTTWNTLLTSQRTPKTPLAPQTSGFVTVSWGQGGVSRGCLVGAGVIYFGHNVHTFEKYVFTFSFFLL